MPDPMETGQILYGGTPWDIIQAVGASATFLAFIFIIIQTRSFSRQTELLEKDMNYRFRPWIYPVEAAHPLLFLVNRSKDSSRPGLYIRIKREFVNEGTFSTRSVNIYITFSKERITEYRDKASHQSQSAIFPRRTFTVEDCTFFEGLTITDERRGSLNYWIFISILIEYEYGDQENLKHGLYRGLYGIDRFSDRTDTTDYEHYHPILFDLVEYAE